MVLSETTPDLRRSVSLRLLLWGTQRLGARSGRSATLTIVSMSGVNCTVPQKMYPWPLALSEVASVSHRQRED